MSADRPTSEGRTQQFFYKRLVTRRNAIRAGVYSALGVLFGIGLSQNSPLPETPPVPVTYDQINLHGRTFQVLISEHGEADWIKNQAAITQAIERAPVIIPEYWPPEYNNLKRAPIVGGLIDEYNTYNAMFDHVAQVTLDRGKPVWVVDPAHDTEAINVRGELLGPSFIASALGLMGSVEFLARRNWKKENFSLFPDQITPEAIRTNITTRLGAFFTMLTADIILFAKLFDQGANAENNLRHVVSAELLDRLAASGNLPATNSDSSTQESPLLLMPDGHWHAEGKGIKYYLQHKDERQELLALYEVVFGTRYPSLFEARFYQPHNGSNIPDQTIKLLPSIFYGDKKSRRQNVQ